MPITAFRRPSTSVCRPDRVEAAMPPSADPGARVFRSPSTVFPTKDSRPLTASTTSAPEHSSRSGQLTRPVTVESRPASTADTLPANAVRSRVVKEATMFSTSITTPAISPTMEHSWADTTAAEAARSATEGIFMAVC